MTTKEAGEIRHQTFGSLRFECLPRRGPQKDTLILNTDGVRVFRVIEEHDGFAVDHRGWLFPWEALFGGRRFTSRRRAAGVLFVYLKQKGLK